MGLFRRLLRREDAYDDLDAAEAPLDDGDSGTLEDAFADDYEDEEPGGGIAGMVSKVLAGLVVVGLFGAVILYAYSWTAGSADQRGRDVPVVEAEPGPEKVKPEDPEGMDVPYQDQLVLNQDAVEDQGETLLPPPEAPKTADSGENATDEGAPAPEGDKDGGGRTDTSAAGEPGDQLARSQRSRTPEDTPGEPGDSLTGNARERDAGADSASTNGADAPGGQDVPRPRNKPAVPDTIPDANGEGNADRGAGARETAGNTDGESGRQADRGGDSASDGESDILIQLAAFQERANAEKAWQRIQDKHRNLLNNQKLQLQRVRIPEKGIFWRVRTGPFPNRATAADLCGQLKDRGQPCLVTEK